MYYIFNCVTNFSLMFRFSIASIALFDRRQFHHFVTQHHVAKIIFPSISINTFHRRTHTYTQSAILGG
uniref:Putative secreted peptide n=1 Tax=Anopheles braziliensis TaxID=58242 RepID=A0A2M3ZSZ2_9DIPT